MVQRQTALLVHSRTRPGLCFAKPIEGLVTAGSAGDGADKFHSRVVTILTGVPAIGYRHGRTCLCGESRVSVHERRQGGRRQPGIGETYFAGVSR